MDAICERSGQAVGSTEGERGDSLGRRREERRAGSRKLAQNEGEGNG